MEMVLNNGFCEMSQDEIMLLEGGGVWRHIGYAGLLYYGMCGNRRMGSSCCGCCRRMVLV